MNGIFSGFGFGQDMAAATDDRIGGENEGIIGFDSFAFCDSQPQCVGAAQLTLERGFINIGRNDSDGGNAHL